MDRETAIRRITARWREQCEIYPTMRDKIPLELYLAVNLPFVMGSQLGDEALKRYDAAA